MRVFQQIVSEGIKYDKQRRENEVKQLMAVGFPWEYAYRKVNFPNMTKEYWDKMNAEYDVAFGTKQ